MSVFSEDVSEWVYRIFDRRTVSVKAKNEQVRKVAALDLATNLHIAIDVPANIELNEIEVGKDYLASLKVYTAQKIGEVAKEFVEFFKVLDVDQSMDDFIKAYWLYPKLIKFELVETETP